MNIPPFQQVPGSEEQAECSTGPDERGVWLYFTCGFAVGAVFGVLFGVALAGVW